MARVKRGVVAHRRHKKILDRAKGYYGARSRVYRVAFQAVIKAGQYAYRDRRNKKRQFRSLWIARINAGARQNGLSYSRMISGLKKAQVIVDRRVLADIAMHDAVAFAALAEKAKTALAA
ncbi:50S ribosomal protein L20 [Acinetobacter sp. HY1485]|uniref:50S ribosomal protein L20 n=1 Tax=Acinetobacter sp. HY1485 TaxID=2970918 RepID=UPI0022B94CF1|nr:50S ribosomal protein L20 [Acinetobacter sp. HY1485]